MRKRENLYYKGRCKYEKERYFSENYKKTGMVLGKINMNSME